MKGKKGSLKLMMIITFFVGIVLGQAWMHPELFYKDINMDLVVKITFILFFITALVGLIIFRVVGVLKMSILFFLGMAIVNLTVYFQIWIVSEIILFITMIVLTVHLIKHRHVLF